MRHRHRQQSSRRARSHRAPGVFVAPQMAGQETDVYFFGETVEKIGPKKYKITNGGFTTCVQPTPRWDLHAGTMTLNVDDYTLLWNRRVQRQGRADALPPGHVLPDEEGGSRDRLPAADLRARPR